MSKPTKQFTRAELEAMPWSQLIELANSSSDEMNRIGESDLRELAFGEFVLSQQQANEAQQREAEAEAEIGKMSQEDIRKFVEQMADKQDKAQIQSDIEDLRLEPLEDMTQEQILSAYEKVRRNERLREAGQSDILDNADDPDAEAPSNNNNNHNRPSDDPRYEQARDDADYILRASDDALNAALKDKLGVTTEDVAKLKAANAINQSNAIQQAFIEKHPEFVANERNGALMRDHVMARGHSEFTEANLEAAFSALKDVVTGGATSQPQRNLRRSSSVSTRGKSAPSIQTEPSLAQLEALAATMPLDQFRELCVEKTKSAAHAEAEGWSGHGR